MGLVQLDTGRAVQLGMRGSLYHPDDLEAARKFGFEVKHDGK